MIVYIAFVLAKLNDFAILLSGNIAANVLESSSLERFEKPDITDFKDQIISALVAVEVIKNVSNVS